jgi:hypothetical protein
MRSKLTAIISLSLKIACDMNTQKMSQTNVQQRSTVATCNMKMISEQSYENCYAKYKSKQLTYLDIG